MEDKKLRIVVVEPGKAPFEQTISNELKNLQKIVEGHIEVAYPFQDKVCLVCNETGLLDQLPLNRQVTADMVIAGTFFVCGIGEEDFESLSPQQVQTYMERFRYPELFVLGFDNHVTGIKVKPVSEMGPAGKRRENKEREPL